MLDHVCLSYIQLSEHFQVCQQLAWKFLLFIKLILFFKFFFFIFFIHSLFFFIYIYLSSCLSYSVKCSYNFCSILYFYFFINRNYIFNFINLFNIEGNIFFCPMLLLIFKLELDILLELPSFLLFYSYLNKKVGRI